MVHFSYTNVSCTKILSNELSLASFYVMHAHTKKGYKERETLAGQ